MSKTKYKFYIGEKVFVLDPAALDEVCLNKPAGGHSDISGEAGKTGTVLSRKFVKRDGERVEKYIVSRIVGYIFSFELYSLKTKLEMLDGK